MADIQIHNKSLGNPNQASSSLSTDINTVLSSLPQHLQDKILTEVHIVTKKLPNESPQTVLALYLVQSINNNPSLLQSFSASVKEASDNIGNYATSISPESKAKILDSAALTLAGLIATKKKNYRLPIPQSTTNKLPATITGKTTGVVSTVFSHKLASLAVDFYDKHKLDIVFDRSYQTMTYPNGQPQLKGMLDCADVIVCLYRELGIDLQTKVHQDKKSAMTAYPPSVVSKDGVTPLWYAPELVHGEFSFENKSFYFRKPDFKPHDFTERPKMFQLKQFENRILDPNQDHRLSANLHTFFERNGLRLNTPTLISELQPGSIIFTASKGTKQATHIGIVSNKKGFQNSFMVLEMTRNGVELTEYSRKIDKIIGVYQYPKPFWRN